SRLPGNFSACWAYARTACDEPLASLGSHRPPCCTNAGRTHVFYQGIKACRLCPRTLLPEKSPPNRQAAPSLPPSAAGRHLVCSSAAEVATQGPRLPAGSWTRGTSPRLPRTLHHAQVLCLMALAN